MSTNYDGGCIKNDVCDMAVCDSTLCNHYISKAVVENCHSLQQRYAKIAAELERCAVDMNTDKLIPIVTCLKQWARLLRQ